jgi:taurine transport system permease protein
VAADKGLGSMILIAKNFLQTEVVVIGIIIIGAIGFAIEMLMRRLEAWLIPWRGKG